MSSEFLNTGMYEFYQSELRCGKLKRMDRVLIDCLILSVVVTLILGSSVYIFGPELLHIYSNQADVIKYGMEIFSYTTVTYFLCGI